MRGHQSPAYMRALHALKREVCRELDRAQVGAPVPEDDPMVAAFLAVLELRVIEPTTAVLR